MVVLEKEENFETLEYCLTLYPRTKASVSFFTGRQIV
jgi:hypothetical protein